MIINYLFNVSNNKKTEESKEIESIFNNNETIKTKEKEKEMIKLSTTTKPKTS